MATEGTRADCSQAGKLIEGIGAAHLIADKGDDSDAIAAQAQAQGMQVQIPSHRNRKRPREYDAHLYRHRHRVENAFLHLKPWRGIATRYAKRLDAFLAAVQIRCLTLWLRIS
jgi:transposase